MSAVPVEPAILSFAALSLSAKVKALAAAAIKVENDFETRGSRGLGHPGERPWDYREVIASEMLGLRWTGCNNQGALLSGGWSTSWFLRRAGVSLSDAEVRLLGQYIAVVASAAPENRFAGIIGAQADVIVYTAGVEFPC